MRYPPDEFQIIENGIIITNQIGPDTYERQFINIGVLSVQPPFKLIHKHTVDKVGDEKMSQSKINQLVQPLEEIEICMHYSRDQTSPYQIIVQHLVDKITSFRKDGVKVHLLTQPHRGKIHLLIIGVQYFPSQISSEKIPAVSFIDLPVISIDPLKKIEKMLQFSKNGIHFSSKIKRHSQRIIVDKKFVIDVVGKLSNSSQLDNPISHLSLTEKIRNYRSNHLVVFAKQKEYEHFISKYYAIKSDKEKHRMIKIGGKKPNEFVTLSLDKLGLGLIELVDDGFLEDYNDLFQLASELFGVYDLGEEFIKFWKEYKQSLDDKELKELTFNKLYQTIKATPMDLFEIPISPHTKHRLILFLDGFYHKQAFRKETDYITPDLMFIPLTDANSDVFLLFMLLRISGIAGEDYSTIWIDNQSVMRTIYNEKIRNILSRLLHGKIIISRMDFPSRNVLTKFDKLFIKTRRQHFHYLNQLLEKNGAIVVEGKDYYVNSKDEIFSVIDDYNYEMYKEKVNQSIQDGPITTSEPGIEEVVSKEIFSKTKTEGNSKKKVNPDEVIDEFEKLSNETTKVSNKISGSENEVLEKTAKKPLESTLKTKNIEIRQEEPKNKDEEVQHESSDKQIPEIVQLFNDTFDIDEYYKSKRSHGIDLIEIIEEQSQIFSIINRLKHAHKSFLSQEEFAQIEREYLELGVDREIISREVADHTKYRLVSKGKNMYSKMIDKIKRYEKQVGQLTENDLSEILSFLQSYSKHSYAISLLHTPIILGINYYGQFRIVPPEILALMNILDRITFRIREPDHFSDIFRAKFVPIFNKYREEIVEEKSKVRQEYIDTTEKEIPKPNVGIDPEETKEKDTNWDLKSGKSSQKKKKKPKQELIVDNQTDDVDKHLKKMKKGKLQFPRVSRKKKDRPEIIPDHTPSKIDKDIYTSIIESYGEEYELVRDNFELKILTKMYKDQIEEIPVIYQPTKDFDFKEYLTDVNFQFLNLNSRIKNILGRKGIDTVKEFVTHKFTRNISGIGATYLDEIKEMQELLVTDHLKKDDLHCIINDEGIALLVTKGADFNVNILSSEIFYKPEILIQKCLELISENNSPEEIISAIITEISQHLDIDRADNLEEMLSLIDQFQKENFPILFEEEGHVQKELNLRYVHSLQKQFEENEIDLETIRDNLRNKIAKLLFSVQFYPKNQDKETENIA